MRKLVKLVLIVFICATIAAWLKMCIPGLSFYWKDWYHGTLRNKLGITIGIILYELYYLGWLYLLAISGYAIANRFILGVGVKQQSAITLGLLVGMGTYLLLKFRYYLISTSIYANHSEGHLSRPWYSWIVLPQDVELLFIYSITGLVGGWLYYRWLISPRSGAAS